MDAQYEALRDLITPSVRELMRQRLLEGVKFFDGHTLKRQYSRAEVKLALLLVKIANPSEPLTKDEKVILSGGQQQTPAQKQQTSSKDSAN